jgi:hypothetical protein
MSNTITTTINYSTRPADGSGPFTDLTKTDPATGKFVRNWTERPTQIEVEDLRGKENSATLDTTGFQFGTHKSAVEGFYDEQEIKDVYYPESVELIKQATGASDVLIFDHSPCLPQSFHTSRAYTFFSCPSPEPECRWDRPDEAAARPQRTR